MPNGIFRNLRRTDSAGGNVAKDLKDKTRSQRPCTDRTDPEDLEQGITAALEETLGSEAPVGIAGDDQEMADSIRAAYTRLRLRYTDRETKNLQVNVLKAQFAEIKMAIPADRDSILARLRRLE